LGFFINIGSSDNADFESIASGCQSLNYNAAEPATIAITSFNLQSLIAPALRAGTYARYKFVSFQSSIT
jgi:hypothetical protein